MKTQIPHWVRCILPAWVIGVTVLLGPLMMLDFGVRSRLLISPLRPVLIAVGQMGYGVDFHNWRASIVAVMVGSILYGAIVFVIMLLAVRKR